MKSGKSGVVYGVVIVVLVAASLAFVLSAPTSAGGGLTDPSGIKIKGVIDHTVYADASGWNYSHGQINPTLYFPVDYKIVFTVIEEDNLPHTFTLNKDTKYAPGTPPTHYESATTGFTLITTSELTQVPGHSVTKSYIFFKTGNYTYWCEIHPTTMDARIQINGTAESTTVVSSLISQPIICCGSHSNHHSVNLDSSSSMAQLSIMSAFVMDMDHSVAQAKYY